MATALLVLGGFLAGGAWALRVRTRPLAAVLGICAVVAVVAVVAGVLRLR